MTRKLTRRNFLKGMGLASIVVAGGLVWRAADSGVFSTAQGAAYEPWTNWRDAQDPRLNLIRAAILASNPHNSQPWLFRLADRRIDVFADTRRTLGAIDPFLRELHIGLGAALSNLLLAARAEGYQSELTLLPIGADPAHVAQVEWMSGTPEASPLYAAIPQRHTDRAAFDPTRIISPEQWARLSELAQGFDDVSLRWMTDPQAVRFFCDRTLEATQAIIDDEQQSSDSFAWQRGSWQELQEKRDGLTYDAQGMGPVMTSIVKLLPTITKAQADRGWFEALRDRQLATTTAVGLIVTRDALDARQQLTAGRLWQLLHLQLTVEGLGAQPLNQLVERRDREIQLGGESHFGEVLTEMVGDNRWSALMPFRVGYPTLPTLPSPRRDLQAVLL
ncbi:Putative NAD(P)H nitroreductase [Thermoflexales bacterium]|nr:Putative NAD(P)H nitroreductase [Thermoflexales bacterium]